MTLLVRDEADILSENIAFHRAMGVDHFIVTDNLSRDATPEILARFVEEGIVTLITETDDDYDQSAWVTRMARLAATDLAANWVINADADEFWYPRTGTLPETLGAIPPDCARAICHRHDFPGLRCNNVPWYRSMVYRKVRSVNHLGKPLPPKIVHRAHPEVVVLQGNHDVTGVPGEALEFGEIEILHFPIRSRRQFENKIRNGGRAYQRNTKLPTAVGRGWRNLYAQLCETGSLESYLSDVMLEALDIETKLLSGDLIYDDRLARMLDSQSRAAPIRNPD